VLVDAGFLPALLSRRDSHHQWTVTQAAAHVPPWRTCEAVASETIHLLGASGVPGISELLRRRALTAAFNLDDDLEAVLQLLRKVARTAPKTRRCLPCADDRDASGSADSHDRFRLPHLSPA
jgi:uncharacterized protein